MVYRDYYYNSKPESYDISYEPQNWNIKNCYLKLFDKMNVGTWWYY